MITNKLTLPSMEIRPSYYSLTNRDFLQIDLRTSNRIRVGGKKLKIKHDIIDKWKQKYDETHKFMKRTLQLPIRSLSTKQCQNERLPFLVKANRKSIHFLESKPRSIQFLRITNFKEKTNERKVSKGSTPRQWQTIQDRKWNSCRLGHELDQ